MSKEVWVRVTGQFISGEVSVHREKPDEPAEGILRQCVVLPIHGAPESKKKEPLSDMYFHASAMADALGDESWKNWSQEQANEVAAMLDRLVALGTSKLAAIDGKCPKCGTVFWTTTEIVQAYEAAKKYDAFFDKPKECAECDEMIRIATEMKEGYERAGENNLEIQAELTAANERADRAKRERDEARASFLMLRFHTVWSPKQGIDTSSIPGLEECRECDRTIETAAEMKEGYEQAIQLAGENLMEIAVELTAANERADRAEEQLAVAKQRLHKLEEVKKLLS